MKTLTKYIATGLVTVSLAGVAFADVAKPMPLQPQNASPQMLKLQKPKPPCHKGNKFKRAFKHSFMGSWAMGLHGVKQLTPTEAKTVADAAVILYGDSSMKVGKITAVPAKKGHENYQVQITNQDGKILKTYTMSGINGKLMKPKPTPVTQ